MSTTINEIAPDIFRINTFFSDFNLGFSQFLVRDDEPLLFHTGMRGLFPTVREAVAKLIDPADPYTPMTDSIMKKLMALNPKVLAAMHGSVFEGDGAKALQDFSGIVREIFGQAPTVLAVG